ncbi:MAG: hypothetical protein J6I49_07540 [Bacteroidales bacterium]|nr:hypothetical protein [Bacteroidales bacterium]
MEKRLIILAALAAGMAVACQKENVPAVPEPPAEEGKMLLTVEGYTDLSGAKTSVSGTSVQWVVGDAVSLYRINLRGTNGPQLQQETRTVQNGSSVNYSASTSDVYGVYPANCDLSNYTSANTSLPSTYKVKLPSTYTSTYRDGRQVIGLPMIGYAPMGSSATMQFRHLTAAVLVRVKNCTSRELTLQNVSVQCHTQRLCADDGISVTMDGDMPTINPESYTSMGNDVSTVTVNFDETATVAPGEIIDVQVPIRPIGAAELSITVKGSAPAQQGTLVDEFSYTFSHKTSSVALGRNVMLTARIRLDPTSQYVASPGTFSVSPTKAVYFSQGNLQYQPSTGTWRFATNQYDYCGSSTTGDGINRGNVADGDNSQLSPTYSGWIDLFYFGTSGYGTDVECDYPYSYGTIATDDYYHADRPQPGPNLNAYEITSDFDLGTSGEYSHYDWGVHNAISNGGGQAGLWRTLTANEWRYLIQRDGKAGLARVSGKGPGLVLLPDKWENPVSCPSFNPGVTYNDYYTKNTYTAEQWADMEAAGAVLLSGPGMRLNGSNYYYSYETGYYWSSTFVGNNGGNTYALHFDEGSMAEIAIRNYSRHMGFSVRLVCDAN